MCFSEGKPLLGSPEILSLEREKVAEVVVIHILSAISENTQE